MTIDRSAVTALLAEARAYGIQLVAEGTRLRIGAPDGALTASFRAKIVALKPEILAHLRGEAEDGDAAYGRAVAAWRADFLTLLARANGYSDAVVRVALDVLARQPRGWDFRVGKDAIVVEMGEGMEVRVHRLPQPWLIPDGPREQVAPPENKSTEGAMETRVRCPGG